MIINNWHQLEISKLTLHFYSHNINKKQYKFIGSAWRGMFGNILSKAVCNYNAPVCFNCPSAGSCSYPTLFKPLNNKLLSPFWLHRFYTHNNNNSNSCDYDVEVCWIGQHSYEISYWLEALAKFTHKEPYHLSISKNYNSDRIYFKNANNKVDNQKDNNKYLLSWDYHKKWVRLPEIINLTNILNKKNYKPECKIKFITPLVSKHSDDIFTGALITRLQRLILQFGDKQLLPREDFWKIAEIIEHKQYKIKLSKRTLIANDVVLSLKEITHLGWEILQMGQILHAGGQTIMGCGAYKIIS